MKANEAPDRIYVHCSKYAKRLCASAAQGKGDIEYTRTDAFIEKACEWIKMMWSETDNRFKEDYTEMLVENFKNYMKEE